VAGDVPASRPVPGRLVAALLLVGSGAAALAHEAAWQRLWVPVAGAGVATGSAVVAGTLLGLALGAGAGGRWADRATRPGLLFAAAEACGAALAFLVPFAVSACVALQRALPPDAEGSALALVRVAVVAVVCAVPSFALGASLPAAVRVFARSRGDAGPLLGLLYAANTFGAVLGVLASSGWAFEAVGTRATVALACAVQLAVAASAALALRRPVEARAVTDPAPSHVAAGERSLRRRVAAAAFLAGAAGLVVEIAWMRRLAPALGTTTYAFGTVLGAFLVAVALGSWLLGPRRGGREAGARPALVLAIAALPAWLLAPALGPVGAWTEDRLRDAVARGDTGSWTLLAIRGGAASALVIPSALVGAAALPWLVRAVAPDGREAGTAAGRTLLANGLGSSLAAAGTGFGLVPAIGTAGSLRLAGALYLGAASFVAPRPAWRRAATLAGAALLVAALVPLPDAAAIDAVGASFDPGSSPRAERGVAYAKEGRVSTVVVRDADGRRELWVDGKVVASAQPTDRMHLALLGHLPMLLHPAPRRVAVVALGTGITSRAVAVHRPERLEIVELEPAVAEAARAFEPVGGGVPASARLRFGDGRDLLARSEGGWDVITSDPIHPHVAGSASLYTVEYYRTVADRLAEGGVFCQWMSLYEASEDDLRMVLRTLAAVFEVHVFVAGPDLVMVATKRPLAIDPDATSRRIAGGVRASLEPLGLADLGRLLGLLAAGPDRVRRFADEGPHGPFGNALNTDDRTILEFSCARSQFLEATRSNLRLVELGRADPHALLARTPSDAAAFDAGLARSARLRAGMRDWVGGTPTELDRARATFAALAESDSSDRLSASMAAECGTAYADALVAAGRLDEAREAARWVLARERLDAPQRLSAAETLAATGDASESRAAALRALEDVPASARAKRLAGVP
jgi:spermidine synthase